MNIADRRAFLSCFAGFGGSALLPAALWAQVQGKKSGRITRGMLRDAAGVAGLSFTDRELDAMLEGVNQNLTRYEALHKIPVDNSVAPPLYFNPVVPGMKIDRTRRPLRPGKPVR